MLLNQHNTCVTVWKDTARKTLYAQQERVIEDLKEKLRLAPEKTSDEFMYQDKAEVQRELDAEEKLLTEIPPRLSPEDLKERTWNVLPYKRYRGADEEDK